MYHRIEGTPERIDDPVNVAKLNGAFEDYDYSARYGTTQDEEDLIDEFQGLDIDIEWDENDKNYGFHEARVLFTEEEMEEVYDAIAETYR